jgi:peptide/nickel transport system substrate-binding protein
VIEERIQNEYLVLRANEHYWGEKPIFERVILKNVQSSLEQMTLLKQGEIDIAWDLLPDQVEELIEPGFEVLGALTFSIYYLSMNLRYEPFSKLEVRDAIRYAIDYDELIQFVLEGAAIKLQTFIPKGILGYNPALPYQHDAEKAKQLLSVAGYPDGFEVDLKCFDWAPWLDVAMKIKHDLAKIGIQVNVNPAHPKYTIPDFTSRKFQILLIRWLFDYADPDANAKAFSHSDSLGDDATFQLPAWYCSYLNQETSNMVEQAAQELDVEKREALYTQIADIIVDDGPFVFLYTPIHQYGLRSEIAAMLNPEEVSEYDLPIPYRQAGTGATTD